MYAKVERALKNIVELRRIEGDSIYLAKLRISNLLN